MESRRPRAPGDQTANRRCRVMLIRSNSPKPIQTRYYNRFLEPREVGRHGSWQPQTTAY